MFKRLSGTLTNLTWPDNDVDFMTKKGEEVSWILSQWNEDCSGHRGSDVYPFGLMADEIDKDFKVSCFYFFSCLGYLAHLNLRIATLRRFKYKFGFAETSHFVLSRWKLCSGPLFSGTPHMYLYGLYAWNYDKLHVYIMRQRYTRWKCSTFRQVHADSRLACEDIPRVSLSAEGCTCAFECDYCAFHNAHPPEDCSICSIHCSLYCADQNMD